MGAFAEFERALIRERQREGIALAKQRGAYWGLLGPQESALARASGATPPPGESRRPEGPPGPRVGHQSGNPLSVSPHGRLVRFSRGRDNRVTLRAIHRDALVVTRRIPPILTAPMKTNPTVALAGTSLPHGQDTRFCVRAARGFACAIMSACSSAPPCWMARTRRLVYSDRALHEARKPGQSPEKAPT